MKWLVENEKKLEDVASEVLLAAEKEFENGHAATVLALYGDLGAGKTTFTKQLAKKLLIKESVTSPTFIIQKSFDVSDEAKSNFKKLIHIDSYRLDLSGELLHLGWTDLLNQKTNLVVVEWPERVSDILPKKHLELKFKHVDEFSREIEFKVVDDNV